jgi:hypothetical protein
VAPAFWDVRWATVEGRGCIGPGRRQKISSWQHFQPSPSLYYSIPLILPPQVRKPTTVSATATPTAGSPRMALGSGGAMIWWRRCSTHRGEREGKATWRGRGASLFIPPSGFPGIPAGMPFLHFKNRNYVPAWSGCLSLLLV